MTTPPTEPFIVRRVSESDLAQVESILREAYVVDGFVLGSLWSQKQLSDEIRRGGWVLLRQSDLIIEAFVLARELPDAREITMVATSVQSRRRGRMRSLLSAIILELRESDRERPLMPIWLEVHEGNAAARALYRSLGFVEVGVRPRYYPDGGAAVMLNFAAGA
jgi:ribosomal protein S18 acetylase RimI-like enzyme